jgi:hypothetical protein
METESKLNALLQDGNSFQINVPQHGTQNIKIKTYHIGELVLTTGKLMACDLLIIPDERYYFEKHLKPGHYPVVISVAEIQPAGDKKIACAKLSLSEGKTVKWEMAAINDPDPAGKGVRNTYWVDSGTGCFIDIKAAAVLAPLVWKKGFKKDRFEEFCDQVIAEMSMHAYDKHGTTGWANMQIDHKSGVNVVVFASGWGDGAYASYWGYDASDRLTSLVTDFALF